MNYAQPNNLEEAIGLLASESWSILAGGTDFYPSRLEQPMPMRVLDIHALDELRQISITDGSVRIGANATWSDLINADLPLAFEALKLAAREVGSVQIQNRATLVGNLCNASPAADGVPPLLILDARVELVSVQGTRQIPLQQFILGNRHTTRRSNEIVSAIVVPKPSTQGYSTFIKLGARKYLIISISMIAARLVSDNQGIISEAAIAVGSCSVVAQRLHTLEAHVVGQPLSPAIAEQVSSDHLSSLAPIHDVRSSADYRMSSSMELIKRSLSLLGSVIS